MDEGFGHKNCKGQSAFSDGQHILDSCYFQAHSDCFENTGYRWYDGFLSLPLLENTIKCSNDLCCDQ